MNNEEETFKLLRRQPYKEVCDSLVDRYIVSRMSVITGGFSKKETKALEKHIDEYGWTTEDFRAEVDRRMEIFMTGFVDRMKRIKAKKAKSNI